ncbi:maleylpyruvate isomerase family mycothiol-dependent enzyme [soil metagenome]
MSSPKPDLKRLATEERTSLLDVLRTLTPEQWATRSLCPGWTVREVAIHIISYDDLSWPGLGLTFLKGGPRVSSVNAVAMRPYNDLSNDGVLDLIAKHLVPRGLTAGFGGGIALTDGTIHHQDIRRALNLRRTIPAERLRPVLDFALGAPTIPAKGNAKGLRLVATDLDWEHGKGLAVTGPGEALLMATAGRPDALKDLAGPGLATISARLAT